MDISPGTQYSITHAIMVGDRAAFSPGEIVTVENVNPDPSRPESKYVVFSAALQQRFLLGDGDLSPAQQQLVNRIQPPPVPISPTIKSPLQQPSTPGPSKGTPDRKKLGLVIGGALLVLIIIIVIALVASMSGKKGKGETTTSSQTSTKVETTASGANDFIATDIYDGQSVNAGPCAVNGTVKQDCSLTLNGQPVAVDATSKKFAPVITINEGANTLSFAVTDSNGKKYTKALTVTGILSPETYKQVSPAGPDFAHLNKNPDSYKGTRCKYTGQVVQIMEGDATTDIRMNITAGEYGIWSDTIYVVLDGKTPAVENNIVTVYGTIAGSYTYTSEANYKITLPRIDAKYCDVVQ